MYCENCGISVSTDSIYCPNCGQKLPISTDLNNKGLSSLGSKNKGRLWVTLLGALLLTGFVIALISQLLTLNPGDVVEDQLEAIKENRITEAYYNYTSKEFQEASSLEFFKEFIKTYPALANAKTIDFEDKEIIEDKASKKPYAILKGVLTTEEDVKVPLEYKLVKEDGTWKIINLKLTETVASEAQPDINATAELIAPVEAHLKALQSNDVPKAYHDTVSRYFVEGTPLDKYEQFIKEYPILTAHKTYDFKEHSQESNSGMVTVILDPETVAIPVEFKLIKEDSKWKILSLLIKAPSIKIDSTLLGKDPKALIPPVEGQLNALNNQDLSKAYQDYASKEFKAVTSFDSFQAFIKNFPVLSHHKTINFHEGSIQDGTGKLQVSLEDENGITLIEYILGVENTQWKIWGMQVLQFPEKKPTPKSSDLQY